MITVTIILACCYVAMGFCLGVAVAREYANDWIAGFVVLCWPTLPLLFLVWALGVGLNALSRWAKEVK